MEINFTSALSEEIVSEVEAEWIIFGIKKRIGIHLTVGDLTMIPTIVLVLLAGNFNLETVDNETIIKIDQFIQCIADTEDAKLLKQFRSQLESIFERFMKNHRTFQISSEERIVLDAFISIVRREDTIERQLKEKQSSEFQEFD